MSHDPQLIKVDGVAPLDVGSTNDDRRHWLFAPGGTSEQLVDRIHHDVTDIVKRPDFVEKYLTKFGIDLVASTPAEIAATIRDDVKITAEMVKAVGVQAQ